MCKIHERKVCKKKIIVFILVTNDLSVIKINLTLGGRFSEERVTPCLKLVKITLENLSLTLSHICTVKSRINNFWIFKSRSKKKNE